ncbi:aspartate/glutamate racemase family protein [Peptoniphilaceae bacterium SGI.137]|nr:amino acid racemase [Peptoniphilaceae bacterium]
MKTIGIIGGLGPLATADLFQKIIENTPAERDQDHIPVLIYNNPQVPDRTAAILRGGESPVREIIRTGYVLEQMGADFLCLPCNTSFYYYDRIQSELSIPLLNLIDLTAEEIQHLRLQKVSVLGTEGTLRTGLYQKKIEEKGVALTVPTEELMAQLQYAIYEIVKKKRFDLPIQGLRDALTAICENEKPDAFVLACTELPILFEKYHLPFPILDPTEILAREAVRRALL